MPLLPPKNKQKKTPQTQPAQKGDLPLLWLYYVFLNSIRDQTGLNNSFKP